MATKVISELVDDIDGSPAVETKIFAIDGVTYEIDLSDKNLTKWSKAVMPFIKHARKVPKSDIRAGGRRATPRTWSARERSADIRAWAKSKGLKVNDRGRIPESIVEQYEAAHAA